MKTQIKITLVKAGEESFELPTQFITSYEEALEYAKGVISNHLEDGEKLRVTPSIMGNIKTFDKGAKQYLVPMKTKGVKVELKAVESIASDVEVTEPTEPVVEGVTVQPAEQKSVKVKGRYKSIVTECGKRFYGCDMEMLEDKIERFRKEGNHDVVSLELRNDTYILKYGHQKVWSTKTEQVASEALKFCLSL